ncbi:zinc dependent phospholipase C family protein [Desulfovibrio sp. JC010]|uniref:zinc dependent phospholipase C family protein n=1 Tax=Desulfovibrio sp. JC010 TaxID=2593641 RepID=UPI0013D033AB|nr:zinc dependent phospholipase C family protein [Desulfovibrio sp. JC010]NDV26179.1 zinc dependent phospholipase C family protein [Desulfovibrio sp. JC010]
MGKLTLILFFSTLMVLGFSATCFAWGPGVHMAIGNAVLSNTMLLSDQVAKLLLSNSAIFLYGCLSADIFIGKGSKAKRLHSHNWQTGFNLLEDSDDEHLKAYSLGYMSHLAADIIAHNYYVPNLMKQARSGGRLSHVYIEMLADDQVNWSAQEAARLFRKANQDADFNLRKHMDAKKYSFLFKKKVFHQTIGLLEYKAVSKSLNVSKKVIPAYHQAYLRSIIDYSYRVVVDMLNSPQQAIALNFDPIGADNIASAKKENNWKNALKKSCPFSPRFEIDERITDLPKLAGVGEMFKG